jgi:hypothetical protein
MSVSRLTHITPIGIEQMGDRADSLKDPDVLRLVVHGSSHRGTCVDAVPRFASPPW